MLRHTARRWAFVVLNLFSVACASPSAAPHSQAPPAPAAPTSPTKDAPADEDRRQSAMAERATSIVAAVAKSRELAVTAPFAVRLASREDMITLAKGQIYEHLTPEHLQQMGRIESSLGMLPLRADVEKILFELLEQGVMGMYDPKQKALLIGDFVDPFYMSEVVGHEAAHGIHDMHFDLEHRQEVHLGRSDLDTASSFLVEGDAQASYEAWAAGEAGLSSLNPAMWVAQADLELTLAEKMTEYPIMQRSITMPYSLGTATVLALAQARGWTAVDELYKKPPQSSEQMLHLDKLLARELPLEITVDTDKAAKLLPNHKLAWEDELGEASLIAMLAQVADGRAAREAAAGWGGDRFVALESKDATGSTPAIVIGMVAWDDEKEAKEFAPLFARYAKKQIGEDFASQRRGNKVAYVARAGRHSSRLLEAGWTMFHVGTAPASGASQGGRTP